jgi:hypothetical protein
MTNVSSEFEEKRREYLLKIIDSAYPAEYAYWTSVLTVNAILIGLFSFIAISDGSNRALVNVVSMAIFVCLMSSFLMVSNFYSRLKMFRKEGEHFAPGRQFSQSDFDKLNESEIAEFQTRKKNEIICLFFLAMQSSVIIAILCYTMRIIHP